MKMLKVKNQKIVSGIRCFYEHETKKPCAVLEMKDGNEEEIRLYPGDGFIINSMQHEADELLELAGDLLHELYDGEFGVKPENLASTVNCAAEDLQQLINKIKE